MKKIIFVLLVAMVLFASCGGKGLKAGTYEAENVLADSTITVKVTVDNNGKITDVYFDEIYKPWNTLCAVRNYIIIRNLLFNIILRI